MTRLLFDVALPARSGGTCCTVAALIPTPPSAPVVLVVDGPGNPGASADLVFDRLAAEIRSRLPKRSGEPIWFRRCAACAIAAWLLADGGTTSDCLMLRSCDGWTRRPVPSVFVRRLLSPPHSAAPHSPGSRL